MYERKYIGRLSLIISIFCAFCFWLFRIKNEFDIMPFARNVFNPQWIIDDWYLSQSIKYRMFFDMMIGYIYDLTDSFFVSYIFLKGLLLISFIYVFYKILPQLLNLELEGAVKQKAGKYFELC
jgi:hypothetical protein